MIGQKLISAVAALVLLMAAAGAAMAGDAVPPDIRPAGGKLLFAAEARGVQIYTSTAAGGGPAKWVLEAPLAELTGEDGKLTIHHYAGPSWEASDGSKVVRDKDVPVRSVPAPDAAADIPWLLVTVKADPAAGVLGDVGFVQRIKTHGGAAPAAAPVRADTKVGVPYTATYLFYGKAE
ncbi:DUF3455 domain-containing protein [Labrys monachus]|uniref:DUF3455 domain-containing protein n=1 Tax=Labrys monachus TaxID=217067 RepID=A0ABU0FPB7_9HYPH|nr:DUF3455 domain-containing protein [Labrys monachus]MDQ0396455.1 hypothetical protein [Labrys monachus]